MVVLLRQGCGRLIMQCSSQDFWTEPGEGASVVVICC